MGQMLALIVLFGFPASAQERQLSTRARDLTQALAALRASPDGPAVQERYLKTFPHEHALLAPPRQVVHCLHGCRFFWENGQRADRREASRVHR